MSNQNNSMQKMPVISNVNLSRYKKNIDGEIKVNETNMAVIGNKFNPITKENTGMTFAHLMETKEGIKGYDDIYKDEYREAPMLTIDTDPNVNKVAVVDEGYVYIKKSPYLPTSTAKYFYFKGVGDYAGLDIELRTFNSDTEFHTWKINEHDYCFTTELCCIRLQLTSTSTYTRRVIGYPTIGIFFLPNITNYVSSTSYDFNPANGLTPAVLYDDNGQLKLTSLVAGITNPIVNVDENKWHPLDCCLSGSQWNYVYALTNNTIVEIVPQIPVPGSGIVDYIRTNFDISGNISKIKITSQKNGGIYLRNVEYKSNTKNKIMFRSYANIIRNGIGNGTHGLVTLENGKIFDNVVFRNHLADSWLQGVDIIQYKCLPIDVIDQNFMYFDRSSLFTGFRISNLIRLKNGKWCKITTEGEGKIFPSYDLNENIYHHKNIIDKFDLPITRNTNAEIGNLYSNIDREIRLYNSEDEYIQSCRYVAIGSSVIPNDNMYLPQTAPFLIDYPNPASVTITNNVIKNILFVQRDKTNSNLYNFYDEVYVAPTDGDFIIPLMPSDKIINRNQNNIIIERLDGSKAELLKFNNQIYPVYLYSSIVNNVDNTFVCQGQIYNIINGVITDSDGTGIVDVSDQIYLGCNGVIALFYNERNKSIYQFSASNGLDMLFESDNIETITKVDISNTNDEIYIGYKNYDNEYNLLCIENDGSSYIVDNDFLPEYDFFVGKKGIYIKGSEEGSTWMLHRLLVASDNMATKNNYIETNYFGTDEFKLMNVDRIYLRFNKTTESEDNQEIIVNLSMLTLDDEINEQYTIEPVGDKIYRIAPRQKQCIGIKIRIDGLTNYTLTALSIGVTDDSNVVTDNTVNNNQLDASIFD